MKQRLKAWGDSYILPIACCLVINELGEILLLKRHAEDLGGGKWGFPGGRLETNETAEDAARREMLEETGITLESLLQVCEHELRMPHGIVHMTTYTAIVDKDVSITLDPEEHENFSWLQPPETLTAENMLYGVPSVLRDFDLLDEFQTDPTFVEGCEIRLLSKLRTP